MNNGSKDQELPPIVFQDATETLWDSHTRCIGELKQVHAQVATLSAQVEELQGYCARAGVGGYVGNYFLGEITLLGKLNAAEAELAALREGATVTYRVDAELLDAVLPVRGPYGSLELAAEAYSQRIEKYPTSTAYLVEVITRERILDATGGEEVK